MKNVLLFVAVFGTGALAGIGYQSYKQLKNTPEATLTKLEIAKQEAKAATEESKKAKKEASEEYAKLRNTKKQYQDEIRPDIEAKIRKDLEDYISKADETYEKAKKENELASLKLDMAKKISTTPNGSGIEFIFGGNR